jgi:hypothetical protein
MTHWHICNKYSCDDVSEIPLPTCILLFFFSPQNRDLLVSALVNISKLAFYFVSRFLKHLLVLAQFESKIDLR